MEKIAVTFLGTANAIPTEKRNHSGILVSFSNENILFDCGEGIQRQFRFAGISPAKITRLFISHWHGDHILGIPGLLQTLFMSGYQKTLHIYGPSGTKRNIELIRQLLPNIRVSFEVHELSEGTALSSNDFSIECMQMWHGISTFAYAVIFREKLRIDKKKLAKLKLPNSPIIKELTKGNDIKIENKTIKASQITYREPGKKITIIMDTAFNENAVKLAKNSDILITEATFSVKEKSLASEYKHLTSQDAANIAKKSGSERLILTHLSQRYEHIPQIIEKEAKKIFRKVSIAKDLDSVIL